MNDLCDFEKKVLEVLQSWVFDDAKKDEHLALGAAVSGGADSISLLVSLVNILTPMNIPLHVITVNHFIRPDEETCGDVQFVADFCNKLYLEGKLVSCTIVPFEKGQVLDFAKERNSGIEEAARFLRYKAFDEFIQKNSLKYLCLAHNKNDNYETLLMRILNGSSCEGLRGIEVQREKFLRPLLNVSREEIENYLMQNNYSWRTDSTNLDTAYLRNKIRLKLIPFLKENFEGWESGLETGALRALEDFEIINNKVEDFFKKHWIEAENSADLMELRKLERGLQKRILLKMCNKITDSGRIPGVFLDEVLKNLFEKKIEGGKKAFGTLEIFTKNNRVFVRKAVKTQTDLCFFAIIEEDGDFNFPFGKVKVLKSGEAYSVAFEGTFNFILPKVKLPVCVRNVQPGDEVLCNDGSYKKIADVFSNWHVSQEERELIPVVQELWSNNKEIICIGAKIFGYKIWIVNSLLEAD